MRILGLDDILEVLPGLDVVDIIEQSLVAYSAGKAVVPPPGELVFTEPPGDVHIKYGYIHGEEHYVVKIASGFHRNVDLGLPNGNGLMLVFSSRTGAMEALLLDEGHLTDIRTGAAGAVAARHLARGDIARIGVFGTGTQARCQLEMLLGEVGCRDVLAWGRDEGRLDAYRTDMEALGYRVETTCDPDEVTSTADLIITTTPSTEPLVRGELLREGAHITAVGSDTPTKQEVDVDTLARADVVVADSVEQCRTRGELHHAAQEGRLSFDDVVELGAVAAGRAVGRTSPDQVTFADLTGVAVQDVRIAAAVCAAAGPA